MIVIMVRIDVDAPDMRRWHLAATLPGIARNAGGSGCRAVHLRKGLLDEPVATGCIQYDPCVAGGDDASTGFMAVA